MQIIHFFEFDTAFHITFIVRLPDLPSDLTCQVSAAAKLILSLQWNPLDSSSSLLGSGNLFNLFHLSILIPSVSVQIVGLTDAGEEITKLSFFLIDPAYTL